MVKTCSVHGCKQRFKKDSGIHFFSFPHKRPEILKKWLLAIKRKDFEPKVYHLVCSVHFKIEDFQHNPGSNRKLLKEQAVPSIFTVPDDYQRKPRKLKTSKTSTELSSKQPNKLRTSKTPTSSSAARLPKRSTTSSTPTELSSKQSNKLRSSKRLLALSSKLPKKSRPSETASESSDSSVDNEDVISQLLIEVEMEHNCTLEAKGQKTVRILIPKDLYVYL